MKTLLHIDGMSCEHCVKHVSEALKALDGVSSVKVSLKEKSADVEHSGLLSAEAFTAAVSEAGYEARGLG